MRRLLRGPPPLLVRGPRGASALPPVLSRLACVGSSRALVHTDAAPDDQEYSAGYHVRPLFSQAARRRRLEAALEACGRGEEFKAPKPELSATPGACGAIMNILRENGGPMLPAEILAEAQERWPGVIKSGTHLKQVCMNGLINKLSRVRHNDSEFREYWILRPKGQIRLRKARIRDQRRVKVRRPSKGTPENPAPMQRRVYTPEANAEFARARRLAGPAVAAEALGEAR